MNGILVSTVMTMRVRIDITPSVFFVTKSRIYQKSCVLAFEGLGSGIPKLMGQVLCYDSGKSNLAKSKSTTIEDKDGLFSGILQAIEEFNHFKRSAPESPYH